MSISCFYHQTELTSDCLQAFIFWVVDNFLKKKVMKISPQLPTPSNESAMKYFKAVETVKYYSKTEHADDSESDMLLSMDDEVDIRYSQHGNQSNSTLSRADSISSQYRLLAAEVT